MTFWRFSGFFMKCICIGIFAEWLMIFNKDLWSDSIESPSWPSSQKTRFLANVAHILLLDGFLRFLVGSYIVLFCEIAVIIAVNCCHNCWKLLSSTNPQKSLCRKHLNACLVYIWSYTIHPYTAKRSQRAIILFPDVLWSGNKLYKIPNLWICNFISSRSLNVTHDPSLLKRSFRSWGVPSKLSVMSCASWLSLLSPLP